MALSSSTQHSSKNTDPDPKSFPHIFAENNAGSLTCFNLVNFNWSMKQKNRINWNIKLKFITIFGAYRKKFKLELTQTESTKTDAVHTQLLPVRKGW